MKYATSIYHLCRPVDEGHAIALARAGYNDGADGTCFELAGFPPELRTVDVFRRIVAAVPLPSMFCVYRNDEFLGHNYSLQAGMAMFGGTYALGAVAIFVARAFFFQRDQVQDERTA